MLHMAFLAYAENWMPFFGELKVVVLDEAHVYRGIFGAHARHVFWRFQRLIDKAKANPRWVATSATLSGGDAFFKTLTGRDAVCISESGAPRPGRRLFLMNPVASPYTLACELMDKLLGEGSRTLCFTKARKVTELVYSWLCQRDGEYRKTVSSYRAGFLPSERRRIEQGFFDGTLKGVVSTSAMEVGIDVGGLDACILVGYPGSLISLHQRMGRVGRGANEADIFLIAMPDALDQYFVSHPSALLNRPLEEIILDPENPVILEPHLICAAREKPIEDVEIGADTAARRVLEALGRKGELVLDAEGVRWHTLRRNPHRGINLRTMGESYAIVTAAGKAIGAIDAVRVFRECHKGAIYLHQGQSYEVEALVPRELKAVVRPVNADYYTEVRSDKETEILEVYEQRESGPALLSLGKLKVTEFVRGFVKKRLSGGEVMGEYPLDAPPMTFETEGFWVAVPEAASELLAQRGLHVMGGLHAFEHALIGIFPLCALADRWDLGGISFAHHPQVNGPAVFVYDGYPGGVGLCRKGYGLFETLLRNTSGLIKDCPCESGCPGCIQSPKCGNGNRPLDKEAAMLLTDILEGGVTVARKRRAQVPARPAVPPEEIEPLEKPGRLVFDLETQKLADEVGGWGNIHRMKLALAVAWDLDSGKWRVYHEKDAAAMIEDLLAAEAVIGFNVRRFDMEVLRPYTRKDLSKARIVDLLEVVKERLGFRLSLASLAEANFGESKSADGLQSVQWYREGRMDLIESYCRKDVELTGRLYQKGLDEGHVLFMDKRSNRLRIEVNGWRLGK
jgi:DEAD/DEAH box helicase domain-containing protein